MDCALVAEPTSRPGGCLTGGGGRTRPPRLRFCGALTGGLNLEGNVGLTGKMRIPSLILCGLPQRSRARRYPHLRAF